MPSEAAKQRQILRSQWRLAKRKHDGPMLAIKCPECGGTEGIPSVPILGGVESDTEKEIPTRILQDRANSGWYCANPQCRHQEGVVRGHSLNQSVLKTEAEISKRRKIHGN